MKKILRLLIPFFWKKTHLKIIIIIFVLAFVLVMKGGLENIESDINLREVKKNIPSKDGIGGTCSKRAYDAGYHQKIISYSVYGDPSNQYWFGIPTNVLWIRKLYPDWLIRFYTDNPDPLRDLKQEYPNTVFVCDIRNLPPSITNITDYPKMFWRFLPLDDEQVDVINIRDTDSIVSIGNF